MATITGNEYDHIDINDGTNVTRHALKDTVARADLQDLKSAFANIDGYKILPTSTGYINCGSANININTVTQNANYLHVLDTCSPGDVYIVNGKGGATPKIWCFVNSTGGRVQYATQTDYTASIERVVAPANAAYFISNYQPAQKEGSFVVKISDQSVAKTQSPIIAGHVYAITVEANSDLDDFRTPGNYKITTSAIANTILHIPELTSGRLTVLTLAGNASVHQWYISANNNWYIRELISGNWSAWKRLADYDYVQAETQKNIAAKGAYNALQALIKNNDYDIAFANAFMPISMKNYLDNTQNVHPKVLYFENGFGGHAYWIAYTPYPYSSDAYENPCIAYSDDGYTWTNIAGNPLDDPNGTGYNSDTHLVYNQSTAMLECWYRFVGPETQTAREETIYRRTSSDGVTWNAKEIVYSNTSGNYDKLLSPAVIIDNNKYCIWVVSGENNVHIDYYEAPLSDATSWTKIRELRLTYTDSGTNVNPWHLDVIKDGATYAMLVMCRNNTQISTAKCSLFITTSTDNANYSTPVKVVGGADNWDKYMYRSSIVKVGNKYRIYYSATGGGTTTIYNNAVWGIGITESDTLTSGYIGRYQ